MYKLMNLETFLKNDDHDECCRPWCMLLNIDQTKALVLSLVSLIGACH